MSLCKRLFLCCCYQYLNNTVLDFPLQQLTGQDNYRNGLTNSLSKLTIPRHFPIKSALIEPQYEYLHGKCSVIT